MRQRDSSAELTSKYGFSVVAPTSTTSPSSTAGSRVSCWALLKRWISSRKKIVRSPLVSRRCFARASTSRTSARPAFTADAPPKAAREVAPGRRGGGGFARPGAPVLDRRAQRRAAPQQVVLADELAQRRRPHSRGQRKVAGRNAPPALGGV